MSQILIRAGVIMDLTLSDLEEMGKAIRRQYMDRTTRMINELKRTVRTNEMKLSPKDLLHLDMIIEGVNKGQINMFEIIRGNHDYNFSPEVTEILKKAYGNATVINQKLSDFTIFKEWLEPSKRNQRTKGITYVSKDWLRGTTNKVEK